MLLKTILPDSYLPWQRHHLYTCMQANIKVQVQTLGAWSRFGACANLVVSHVSCPQVETESS